MRAVMSIAGLAIAACLALTPNQATAHSGGLNSEGCHTNRKTGDYHCHRGGGSARSPSKAYGALSSDTSYRNCTAARAAGAAPVRRGDPGYGRHLDRDGDGVGCE